MSEPSPVALVVPTDVAHRPFCRGLLALALMPMALTCCSSDGREAVDGSGGRDPSSTATGSGDGATTSGGGAGGPTTSGGGAGGDGAGGARDLAAEFAHGFADAICDSVEPCCLAEGLPFDAAACKSTLAPASEAFMPNELDHCTYDAEAAEGCFEAARDLARSCPQTGEGLRAMNQACNEVFVGNLAPGEPCSESAECAPPPDGLGYCNRLAPPTDGHPDECIQYSRGALGDTCSATLGGRGSWLSAAPAPELQRTVCDLDDGLFCDFLAEVPTCSELLGLDEACGGTGDCEAGLYCSLVDLGEAELKCASRAEIGDACDPVLQSPDECVDGAYCDESTNQCIPQKAVNEPCAENAECSSRSCDGQAGRCADLVSNAFVCDGA